jgi:hypothetical protein
MGKIYGRKARIKEEGSEGVVMVGKPGAGESRSRVERFNSSHIYSSGGSTVPLENRFHVRAHAIGLTRSVLRSPVLLSSKVSTWPRKGSCGRKGCFDRAYEMFAEALLMS